MTALAITDVQVLQEAHNAPVCHVLHVWKQTSGVCLKNMDIAVF